MERNACLKIFTALSARPFVAGWYGADVIWRMPLDLTNAWHSSEKNCAPLSLTICSGISNLANESRRTSMVEYEVLELTGITSGYGVMKRPGIVDVYALPKSSGPLQRMQWSFKLDEKTDLVQICT